MAARMALVFVLAVLLAPAPATAATIVGSTLPGQTGETLECTDPGGCTFVPRTISGRAIEMPYDGVIVAWSARMPTSADTGNVSVLPVQLTATGATPAGFHEFLPPAPTNGAIVTQPTSQAVSKGDLIAVELDYGDEVGIASHPLLDSLSWSFFPQLSGDRAPDSVDSDNFEALFNARIEPDADHDGHGDETQDKCPEIKSLYARPCKGKPLVHVTVDRLGPGELHAGDPLQIRAFVSSPTREIVADTHVELTLPDGLWAGRVRGALFCKREGQRVTCPLFDLPPGAVVSLDATALRPIAGEVKAVATNHFGDTATATAPVRVATEKRCGLKIPAGDGGERGTNGGDRMTATPSGDAVAGRGGDDCLSGSAGDDILSGGDGDDRVDGGAGSDLVRGDAGDDHLIGGPGRDRIEGGPGADVIGARDGKRDVVRCGPGRDRAKVDELDSVAGCELVTGLRPRR
jgi:hypothetical protein